MDAEVASEASWRQQILQPALRLLCQFQHVPPCVTTDLVPFAENHAQAGSHNGDDEGDGEEARRADLRLLAHTLVGFAAQQDLRLDTFAMGPASRALGQHLEAPFISKFRHLACQRAAYTPFAHAPIPPYPLLPVPPSQHSPPFHTSKLLGLSGCRQTTPCPPSQTAAGLSQQVVHYCTDTASRSKLRQAAVTLPDHQYPLTLLLHLS